MNIINITVPKDSILEDDILHFSPEENFLMLQIGSKCILKGRKVVAGLTQKEIYDKIKEESKEEVKKLELNILIERETSKKMEEKISQMYENQVEQLKKQLETLSVKIKTYESDNSENKEEIQEHIQKEVNKVKDKCDLLLQEKDYQNKLNRESIEKLTENIMKLTNKSTSHKGAEGEHVFSEYAETFQDFNGFELIDKHTQAGSGDFHLHFEEFDVLVDVKNYKKKVPIDQREKIKKDLLKNEHLHFAWLVSLNTTIDKYDKSPIMYEWINTKQCIVYINNLSNFEDPKKILRIVWFTCRELYKFIEEVTYDDTELIELKDKNFKLMDKIKNIRKTIREINTSMNATRNLIQVMDDELREILENETNELVSSNFSLFDDWWEQNLEKSDEECLIVSTDLWTRFKQDNKIVMNELNITSDKFKQYIKTKIPLSSIVLRSKNANSAFDIKGLKLKEVKIKEIELNEEVLKKKKVVKKQKSNFYFDEDTDKKILEDYEDENKDIMILSKEYNVRPWEIVSLLMKHQIISKREYAKGYEEYKKTDEYKNKVLLNNSA